MASRRGVSGRLFVLLLLAALVSWAALLGLPAGAQSPNEREVKDPNPVQEAEASRGGKLWVLDFKFKDPRLIKVNIPGRGQRVCWYVWYQITNRTGAPRTFIPDFELVTHDTRRTYRDEILPTAQEAIAKIEDPHGYYKLKNSVTIAADPIPATLPKQAAKTVTGVAIWTDPAEPTADDDEATKKFKEKEPKLADSNRYSIFVAGLSNGWSQTDPIPPSTKPVIRRKTLQMTFQRLGDKYLMKSEAIRFVAPVQWIYRASMTLDTPAAKDKDKDKDKEKDKEKPKEDDSK